MKETTFNPIISLTDGYKVSQWVQYPPNTKNIFSYIESRGHEEGLDDRIVWVGLQGWIKKYMTIPITMEMIDEAESFFAEYFGTLEFFNREGWEMIVEKFNGYLPLIIRSLPEGTVVPTRTVLATIEAVSPEFDWLVYWITSYYETAILRGAWYPTSIASVDLFLKTKIREAMNKSSDLQGQELEEDLMFRLHDFGARGVSSEESSAIGGFAHLVNFAGTDTLSSLVYARDFYDSHGVGFSIPASEHSTITSWGRLNEKDAFRNMLNTFGKKGSTFACVSDSWNIFEAIHLWGELEDEILEKGCRVVIRPDSGKPVDQIVLKCLVEAEKVFGMTTNSKGYKVLPWHIRFIQGDGIDKHSLPTILYTIMDAGYSAENLYFGMGGGMLQKVDRDTYKFAMKCSSALIDNEWVGVYKDPITDPGKVSKKGRVTTYFDEKTKKYYTDVEKYGMIDAMQTIYKSGEILLHDTLHDIRKLLILHLSKNGE